MKHWRQRLRSAFTAMLPELDPRQAVAEALRQRWQPGDHSGLIIAIGKAARSMALGALDALSARPLRGVVVAPDGTDEAVGPLEVLCGSHPLPDAGSLRAGARCLALAQSARQDETVLFLLSGGGSALCELPLHPALDLSRLRELYQALLGCGAPITTINAVRAGLSAVKGGRLGLAARGAARVLTLAISDVPPGAEAAIAAGPTLAPTTTSDLVPAVLEQHRLQEYLPPAVWQALRHGDLPPAATASALAGQQFFVVQDQTTAVATACRKLRALGCRVVLDHGCDDWPYSAAADHLCARLLRLRRHRRGSPVALLTVGEVTVALPSRPGSGGRNQQFTLACAQRIRGQPIAVLSAGTDGIDGNSKAAGAVADGSTWWRAQRVGMQPAQALACCDAEPLFAALGDLVETGPTGTNLRDIRVLLWHG